MTTETLTLSAFLLARIAEDEAVARVAERYAVPTGPLGVVASACGHTLAVDPARVLVESEAKRRIVERCDYATTDEFGSDYDLAPRYDLGLEVLQALALPYADHPDYREEWKP